jgi:uncharacterized protein (DUF58 family)
MNLGVVTAADGLVIAMLLVMFLSLGVVALLFLTIRRSAACRDAEVERLLEEISAEEEKEVIEASRKAPESDVAAQPWERDGDWWKS